MVAVLNQEKSQAVDERAEGWKEEDATGKPFKGQAGGGGEVASEPLLAVAKNMSLLSVSLLTSALKTS